MLETVRLNESLPAAHRDAADPRPPRARAVTGLRRIGKRIALGFEDDLFLVLHLMIAGRLRWKRDRARSSPGQARSRRLRLRRRHADPDRGRARSGAPSLHVVAGRGGAGRRSTRAGSRCWTATCAAFGAALTAENHTLKRALTDPHIFSGIGNAYSDEILHRARLSPVALTRSSTTTRSRGCSRRRRTTLDDWTRPAARGGGRRLSRRRSPPSARDGRARPLRRAVPRLRRAGAAHPLRRQRDQLLRRAARPAAGCSPTARCPGCSKATGRARWRSWSGRRPGSPHRPPKWRRAVLPVLHRSTTPLVVRYGYQG